MTLLEAEKLWLDQTTEEEVRFELFTETRMLRRPNNGMKALASLFFGQYKDLSGRLITDDRVIWLGFIMSEQPGEGTRLLKFIRRLAWESGLAICGEPVPLKPASWGTQRPWSNDKSGLIAWYLRNDFHVLQNKWQTRIWYVPSNLELSVQAELVDKRPAPD